MASEAIAVPTFIHDIAIEGLWRTKPSVVLRELPFTSGTIVDPAACRLGLTRLWNLGIFSRVAGRIETRRPDASSTATRTVLVLILEERWTLNLLISFGSGGNASWLRLGLADSNVLGRYVELGALYERFGSHHGGLVWCKDPRFLDRRLDLQVTAERLVRPRPAYAVLRTRARIDAGGLLDADRWRISGSVDVVQDRFLDATGLNDVRPGFQAVVAEHAWRRGRVDVVRIRQTGASAEVRAVVGKSLRGEPTWLAVTSDVLAYAAPGSDWNLALRAHAGLQGKATPEHLRLHLGGLQHVRGHPDNALRTRAWLLVNAELRWTAWDSTWLAVVPTAFVDTAVVALAENPRASGPAPTWLAGVGAGVRLLVPRAVRTGLRVDAAVPFDDLRGAGRGIGLSIGVFQFF